MNKNYCKNFITLKLSLNKCLKKLMSNCDDRIDFFLRLDCIGFIDRVAHCRENQVKKNSNLIKWWHTSSQPNNTVSVCNVNLLKAKLYKMTISSASMPAFHYVPGHREPAAKVKYSWHHCAPLKSFSSAVSLLSSSFHSIEGSLSFAP